MAIANVADRAAAYGIPGVIVDGSDVLAVHAVVAAAVERARGGEGPSLIEAKTYRFEGHFLGDPEPYRTKEEVAQARASRDPLIRFGAVLQQLGVADVDSLQRLDARVKDEVERAVTFGEASPEPGEALLLTDIYTGADAAGREV
jgi:pyruvate dehydrogenase E1 component alpha subunit